MIPIRRSRKIRRIVRLKYRSRI